MSGNVVAVPLLHFYEGREGFQYTSWPKPPFLTDQEYGKAIQTFPVVCSDTIAVDPQLRGFWLAKRIVHSAKGPWGFGGRWMRGETHIDAAIRTVSRETSLKMTSNRFTLRAILCGFWENRKLEPQNFGEQNVIFVHSVILTEEERAQAIENLDPKEYDCVHGLQLYDRARIKAECSNRPLLDYYPLIIG
jgi:ADP-ribose pyrophosphatase YjhB (NUDIX family)